MDQRLRKLRREISQARRTLQYPQNYGAQVICYTLKEIASVFGNREANKAIRELGLRQYGWEEERVNHAA